MNVRSVTGYDEFKDRSAYAQGRVGRRNTIVAVVLVTGDKAGRAPGHVGGERAAVAFGVVDEFVELDLRPRSDHEIGAVEEYQAGNALVARLHQLGGIDLAPRIDEPGSSTIEHALDPVPGGGSRADSNRIGERRPRAAEH